MAGHFGGSGVGRPATAAEIRAQERRQLAARRQYAKGATPAGKTALLTRAILEAAAARGAVTRHDCHQAGLSAKDVDTYWDAALDEARKADSRIDAMVSAP